LGITLQNNLFHGSRDSFFAVVSSNQTTNDTGISIGVATSDQRFEDCIYIGGFILQTAKGVNEAVFDETDTRCVTNIHVPLC